MIFKTSNFFILICLQLILISCNTGSVDEIKKQKIVLGKKILNCEKQANRALDSKRLQKIIKEYESLIKEANNFNKSNTYKNPEFEFLLFDIDQLTNKKEKFELAYDSLFLMEEKKTIYEKTKHISYEKKENIVDIESNIYRTIKIGKQVWMADNLSTTKYNNGDNIDNIIFSKGDEEEDNKIWNWSENRVLVFENNYYYDAHVVLDSRNICPIGWHIPSDKEWKILIGYLGGNEFAGVPMKDKDNWKENYNIQIGSNQSGFNARPIGYKTSGNIHEIGEMAGFWSSTISNRYYVYKGVKYYPDMCTYILTQNLNSTWREDRNKSLGFSIRCVQD
jgi:uncharacterized protein (TIGR02145 family)